MTNPINDDNSLSSQHNESDVIVLIKRMHEQLLFLEKKIDKLLNQSQERYSKQEQFSKSARSFSQSPHSHDKAGQGRGFKEGGFRAGKRPLKRSAGESRSGTPKKERKVSRVDNTGKGSSFKQKGWNKKVGDSSKKKPFYLKRDGH